MGEAKLWNKMFGKSPEDKPDESDEQLESVEPAVVKLCHNCGHLVKTVCQNNGQVMKPNDHCSAWTE